MESIKSNILNTQQWAEKQWDQVNLNDSRLEKRAIEIGVGMAKLPGATLPQQMPEWSKLKATYRFLNNPKVSYEQLSSVHKEKTRQAAEKRPLVLLIEDTTELDYTNYKQTMKGLAPIGNGNGQGMHLHTTLAFDPQEKEVLGIIHQQIFQRVPVPAGTNRRQRPKDQRESRVWKESVEAIGKPKTDDTCWVVVADRASDDIDFFTSCRENGMHFTSRLKNDRRLVCDDDTVAYLFNTIRQCEPVTSKMVEIPATNGRKARTAEVCVSFTSVNLRLRYWKNDFLPLWVVRAFETQPPADVQPIEWIIASSLPIETPSDALDCLEKYESRWTIEDYHQCLKTGCTIEKRDFQDALCIQRLLGFLAIIAVGLLQLRNLARINPTLPATTVASELEVKIVASELNISPSDLNVRLFWRGVAKIGGFIGRRRDGDPGWKTLWRGCLRLHDILKGVHLASSLSKE